MIIRFFVANTSKELKWVIPKTKELLDLNSEAIILQEMINSSDWQQNVIKKVKISDFFIVMIGKNTLKNSNIRWEINQAIQEGVIICGIKLPNFEHTNEVKKFNELFPIFDNCENLNNFSLNEVVEKRKISLESYKIFVASTEKVTEQRSKAHTLFFTLLASLMTLSFLIGKETSFSYSGVFAIFLIAMVAQILVYSWEKLVNSYGVLNQGKFEIIYKLENQLGINHFEKEWDILVNKLGYKSNTVIEKNIINIFKYFIWIVVLISLVYLLHLTYKN